MFSAYQLQKAIRKREIMVRAWCLSPFDLCALPMLQLEARLADGEACEIQTSTGAWEPKWRLPAFRVTDADVPGAAAEGET